MTYEFWNFGTKIDKISVFAVYIVHCNIACSIHEVTLLFGKKYCIINSKKITFEDWEKLPVICDTSSYNIRDDVALLSSTVLQVLFTNLYLRWFPYA